MRSQSCVASDPPKPCDEGFSIRLAPNGRICLDQTMVGQISTCRRYRKGALSFLLPAVMPKWTFFRRPWPITNQTYSQRNLNGGNNDEVHRDDAVLVVSEKRFPALALVLVQILLRAIPRDCGETHGETQLSGGAENGA